MTTTYTSSLSFAIGIFVFFLCVRKNNTQTKDASTQTQKQIKRTKIIQTQKTLTKDATTQVEFDIGDFIVVDYCPRV
tara:strand:- start:10190 stop:10420 length:231 start_codon:yes stop_codon:yes gene_type:complete